MPTKDTATLVLNGKVSLSDFAKKKPAKDALKQLGVKDLARLGVTLIDAGDEIVIKPVDGEIDKLVNALLKDATDGEE